tara:strand:- start:3716 stop:5380 length:1665 start_codon:yes stop_codon:yes gene_type:complete
MSRTTIDIIKLVQEALSYHKKYWDDKRPEMQRYRNAYLTEFWKNERYADEMVRVEVSEGYAYIESYISSLFSKAPAVEIGKDEVKTEEAEIAEMLANRFLYDQRKSIESASRMALIYPNAFLKLAPRDSTDILSRCTTRALEPWSVIVDRDAGGWDEQRYCGHHYYLPIQEAKKLYGAKKYTAVSRKSYFDEHSRSGSREDLSDEYMYIEVVEFYDFLFDRLYIWSPNYAQGKQLLVNETIPVRSYDNEPLSCIVPLYYSRVPDKPLDGMAAMGRIYDQLYEKNIMRTFWANSVRRDSRQYLYKSEYLDEEALAKVSAGVDGAMIGVDTDSLDGLIQPITVPPISSNFDRYSMAIDQDIQRGSIMAPFAKGIATRATATEITALAQYSASEVGRMAIERDEAICDLALVYLRMLVVLLDDSERHMITVNGKTIIMSPDAITAKYRLAALDQAATPLSETLQRQNLVQLLPILTQLGVPAAKMKSELVRMFDLPIAFLEEPPPPPAAPEQPSMGRPPGPEDIVEREATGPEALAQELVGKQRTIDLPVQGRGGIA